MYRSTTASSAPVNMSHPAILPSPKPALPEIPERKIIGYLCKHCGDSVSVIQSTGRHHCHCRSLTVTVDATSCNVVGLSYPIHEVPATKHTQGMREIAKVKYV